MVIKPWDNVTPRGDPRRIVKRSTVALIAG
jgi:hypothetical protein